MSGIFRPRQAIARITRNAGNRVFICGGRGSNRAFPRNEVIPVDPPPPPPPPPPPATVVAAVKAVARKLTKGG